MKNSRWRSLFLVLFTSTICTAGEELAEFPIIDMHTHVFNVRYLPVRGIVESKGIPSLIARIIEKLVVPPSGISPLRGGLEKNVESLGRMDRFPDAEWFNGIGLEGDEPVENVLFRRVDPERLTDEEKMELKRWLRGGTEPESEVKSIVSENAEWAKNEIRTLDPDIVAEALQRAAIVDDEHAQPLGMKGLGDKNYLRFLLFLMLGEIPIVETLQREYPEASLFVHHMMDMENAYDQEPYFGFKEQIRRMQALSKLYEGQLLTFVAFDPFRGKQALDLVKEGLNKGAVGVKFYPPSGYRPSNNVEIEKAGTRAQKRQWESRYGSNPPEVLNQTMEEFFAYCADNDIPIFTHCTPQGFESFKDYGANADPEFWKAVLDKHPDLRLCFGHAGGGEGWFSQKPWEDGEKSFAQEVYDLVTTYRNVYCEVAYLDEVFQAEQRAILQNRLLQLARLDREENGPKFPFFSKIMYGSDWHMMMAVNKRRDYIDAFKLVFEHPDLKAHTRDFFAGNATRFLKLKQIREAKSAGHEMDGIRRFFDRFQGE